MGIKQILACMPVLLFCANLYAQKNDSVISQIIIPYEVRDVKEYEYTAGVQVIHLNTARLKINPSMNSLGDALLQTGKVYLRNYGNGMQSSITVRGFGPERTNTIWNGIPIQNPGLGLLDINLLPGGFFNQVKFIEGSSSTQYGNAAQGGSLLLQNEPEYQKNVQVMAHQEFGSFFTWNTSIQASYGFNRGYGKTAIIRNSSLNNYAFTDKASAGFPIKLTENSSFESYQFMQDLFYRWKLNWQASVHFWYQHTDRYIPPVLGAVNNHQRQWDESFRTLFTLRKNFRHNQLYFHLSYINDKLIYFADGIRDSSQIHTAQVQVQDTWNISKKINLLMGGNFSLYHSNYKYYNEAVTELRGNVFVLTNIYPHKKIKLSAGIRQQFSTHYVSIPSGHAGIDYVVFRKDKHEITMKGAVLSAYRMPTLNDLYWVPGGDPNLKAEYSWNVENSWLYSYSGYRWNLQINATGYFGRTHNWIQWVPASQGYWVPKNIQQVQSAGANLQVSTSYYGSRWSLAISASYNYTHAINLQGANKNTQLIYVPEHTITGIIEATVYRVNLRIIPQYFSVRYASADNTQSLRPYFIMNLQATYPLYLKAFTLQFLCRINNATNTDYQTMLNRPMPWINYSAGVQFVFNAAKLKK